MTFDEMVGNNIRTRRKAMKITLDQLGVALGYKKSQMSYIESGKRSLNASQLPIVAAALDTTVEDLLGGALEKTLRDEINEEVDRLSPEQQEAVLTFLRGMNSATKPTGKRVR